MLYIVSDSDSMNLHNVELCACDIISKLLGVMASMKCIAHEPRAWILRRCICPCVLAIDFGFVETLRVLCLIHAGNSWTELVGYIHVHDIYVTITHSRC